jgi:hypothetical protein
MELPLFNFDRSASRFVQIANTRLQLCSFGNGLSPVERKPDTEPADLLPGMVLTGTGLRCTA